MTTIQPHWPAAAVSSAGSRRARLPTTTGGGGLGLSILFINRKPMVARAIKRRRNDIHRSRREKGSHYFTPNNLSLWARQRYRKPEASIVVVKRRRIEQNSG